jgi:hypothetical protein
MTNSEQQSGIVPVSKRYSIIELPDTGEKWPDQFDAITIEQRVTRLYKAKEARRMLDHFFEIPIKRQADSLYGVLWHFKDNEHQGVVMFDTNESYSRASFVTALIVGCPAYGYAANQGIDSLTGEENFRINQGDYLTYFKVPSEFQPATGEVLGMMIGAARDEIRDNH